MDLMVYLTKSTVLLSLFFLVYEFLLKKDTFFNQNRLFLLLGLTTAALLPMMIFTQTVWVEPATALQKGSAHYLALENENLVSSKQRFWQSLSIWDGLGVLYGAGVVFFLLKLSRQLFSLCRLINIETVSFRENGIKYIETRRNTGAFSFFKTIVFNPDVYTADELPLILKHENAHVTHYHYIDILMGHLATVFFWFNPLAWLYKKRIVQNLEFLADSEAVKNVACSKNYQRSLLSATVAHSTELPVTNFHQSFIKTRIIMLNKNRSHRYNSLKTLSILPFLVLFMLGFQIQTEAQVKKENVIAYQSNSVIIQHIKENGSFNFNGNHIDLKDAKDKYYQIRNIDIDPETENAIVYITGTLLKSLDSINIYPILTVNDSGNIVIYEGNFSEYDFNIGDSTIAALKEKALNLKIQGNLLKKQAAQLQLEGIAIQDSTLRALKNQALKFKIIGSALNDSTINALREQSEILKLHAKKLVQQSDKIRGQSSIYSKSNYYAQLSALVLLEITPETSDQQLEKYKKVLKKKDFDFTYKHIKRNSNGEITGIQLKMSNNKGHETSTSFNGNTPIPTVNVGYTENGDIFIKSYNEEIK